MWGCSVGRLRASTLRRHLNRGIGFDRVDALWWGQRVLCLATVEGLHAVKPLSLDGFGRG